MRRAIALTSMVLAVAAFQMFRPRVAECVYCPTYKCYSRCSAQCACVTPPGDYTGGSCYGIEHSQQLTVLGWTVQP